MQIILCGLNSIITASYSVVSGINAVLHRKRMSGFDMASSAALLPNTAVAVAGRAKHLIYSLLDMITIIFSFL